MIGMFEIIVMGIVIMKGWTWSATIIGLAVAFK